MGRQDWLKTRGIIAAWNAVKGKKNMNDDEYTYEEEASLSADRDLFDKCCISCAAEDAFYDIDLIPEEKENRL